MNNEQSFHVIVNLKSECLALILKKYEDVLKEIKSFKKITKDTLFIDAVDDYYLTNVPSDNSKCLKELFKFLKTYLKGESKVIIKELKKFKKIINSELECDWCLIETCSGDLAKEMSQIHKDIPDLKEADRVLNYIYEITLKDNIYTQTEKAVYIED